MLELLKPEKIEKFEPLLSSLVDNFVTVDRTYRERRMREWKKLDLYWHGVFYFYWDAEKEDFNFNVESNDDDDDIDFNRAANIYKAHGESIVSAIGSSFPHVVFFPEDADNADDITAAKAKTSLAKLIRKHNGLDLLLLKATFILFNQDYVACWNKSVRDKKYGIFRSSVIVEEDEVEGIVEIPAEVEAQLAAEQGEDEAELQEEAQGKPELVEEEQIRSRQILDIFGPRNVEIACYVRDMKHAPYLILRQDFSPAELKWQFPEFADKIEEFTDSSQEYWSRTPYNSYSDAETGTAVHEIIWLRPWALNDVLKDHEELANELVREAPKGIRIDRINDMVVKISEEDLDEQWTVSRNPFSDTLHADPLGRPLVDMQEMVNDVLNFTIDTIGHGVGETFVDPTVLDTEQYRDGYHKPGDITGVKAKPGETLSQSFYQNKPAQLSGEIDRFSQYLENTSQLVSGSFPSVYGGEIEGSRTASEYAQSRQQALQRLGTTYKILKRFILEVMDRAVTDFAKNMSEKENFVIKQGNNFVNNWIFKSEITGNTGDVDIEGGDELPVSWSRVRDTIFELMQTQNPLIQAIFAEPQNIVTFKNIIGIPELILPGETSRDKQWAEIAQLLQEEPSVPEQQETPNPEQILGQEQAQPQQRSSIPTNFDLDDDIVELSICKYWINSEQGQFTRKTNPAGYENVVLHAQEHQQNLMMKQAQQGAPPQTDDLRENENAT